jgi:hypothetical protein
MYLLIGAKRRGTYEEERSAYIPSRDAKAAMQGHGSKNSR